MLTHVRFKGKAEGTHLCVHALAQTDAAAFDLPDLEKLAEHP